MECEHKKLTTEQFNGKIKFFDLRKELLLFIFYTINLIIHNGHHYCYCEKFGEKKRSTEKNCDMCRIPIIFCNFEKDIEKNWFNNAFLWKYHGQLAFNLNQVFCADKSALCCFLDDEFHYRGRDWRSGETWSVSQS